MVSKKQIMFGTLAVVLVAAYAAASWKLGVLSHRQFDAWEQKMKENPVALITIIERKYTPGVFSSTEEVTFALNPALAKAFAPGQTGQNEPTFEDAAFEPPASASQLQFTAVNHVRHGPLPGLRSIGLARIRTTLILDPSIRAELSKVFAGEEPVVLTTLIGLTGSGETSISSPELRFQNTKGSYEWQGLEGAIAYNRDMSAIECELEAPGLTAETKDGSKMSLRQLEFECDLERVFEELFEGGAELTLAELRVDGPGEDDLALERISYAGLIDADGEFLDALVKVGIESMQSKELSMTDLHYDLSVRHLHGPTYAALKRKMEESTAAGLLGDPTAQFAMMSAFGEYVPKLLEHSPQFAIDRIAMSTAQGNMGMSGLVQVKDVTPEDLAQKLALLQKLDATADLWADEGFIQYVSGGAGDPESTGTAMLEAKLTELEQQGYVQRKEGRLQMRVEFKQGVMTVNGKPFGPGAQ